MHKSFIGKHDNNIVSETLELPLEHVIYDIKGYEDPLSPSPKRTPSVARLRSDPLRDGRWEYSRIWRWKEAKFPLFAVNNFDRIRYKDKVAPESLSIGTGTS